MGVEGQAKGVISVIPRLYTTPMLLGRRGHKLTEEARRMKFVIGTLQRNSHARPAQGRPRGRRLDRSDRLWSEGD